MMKVLLICTLALAGTIYSAAFAGGTTVEPTILDAGFEYYEADTAYLTASVANGNVIVYISEAPTNGALALSFDEIKDISADRKRELYEASTSVTAIDQAEARSDELTRLRKLAGMDTLGSGWQVVHDSTPLDAAIAAYSSWFGSSGLDMVADVAHSTVNVKAFTASGQGDPLRIVFHRNGNEVGS